MLFLREKSSLCREKVAILPKNLRKVKNMQKKRNFYLQQLIDGKILENTQIFLAETLENTQIFGLPAKACGRFQTFLLFFLRGFLFYFKQCSFIDLLQLIACHPQRSSYATQRPFYHRRIFVLAKKNTNTWIVSLTSKQLVSSRNIEIQFADELWHKIHNLQFICCVVNYVGFTSEKLIHKGFF